MSEEPARDRGHRGASLVFLICMLVVLAGWWIGAQTPPTWVLAVNVLTLGVGIAWAVQAWTRR